MKTKSYSVAMLRDVTNMTMEMGKISLKRQHGWVFSQVYNSYKEIYDAANTKPFSSKFLERLSWDPAIARMI